MDESINTNKLIDNKKIEIPPELTETLRCDECGFYETVTNHIIYPNMYYKCTSCKNNVPRDYIFVNYNNKI